MTVCWDVARSASLDDVLRWCLERRSVNRLLLATRLDQDALSPTLLVPEVEVAVRQLFGDSVLCESFASKWPGTQLIGHSGKVYLVEFNAEMKDRMVRIENSFGGWTDRHKPPLPEDICLFRLGDELPALVSVTHDSDAWLLDDGPIEPVLAGKSVIPLPSDLLPSAPTFFCD